MNGVAFIIVLSILLLGGIAFSFWLEWQAKNGGKGDE